MAPRLWEDSAFPQSMVLQQAGLHLEQRHSPLKVTGHVGGLRELLLVSLLIPEDTTEKQKDF